MLRIRTLGGGTVGASCYLYELTIGSRAIRFLVDCGLKFVFDGGRKETATADLSSLEGMWIDFVILTHAHLDHVGGLIALSKILKRGLNPNIAIYTSEPTAMIANIMVSDTLNIAAKNGGGGTIWLGEEQKMMDEFFERFMVFDKPEWFTPIAAVPELTMYLLPAGHLRGAASILIRHPGGDVLVSGDIGFHNTATVKGAMLPWDYDPMALSDFRPKIVVTEATNGAKDWDRTSEIEALKAAILAVLKQGGNVLLPAFALGRSQDLGILLADFLKEYGFPVWLGGGLPKKIALDVYGNYRWCGLDEKVRIPHANLWFIERDQLEELIHDTAGGKVVIASSGMLDVGVSQKLAHAWASNPKNGIFFTGYQAAESGGRKLLEKKRGEIMHFDGLKDPEREVLADVRHFNLSSHASGSELAEWITALKPQTVLVNHCEEAGFLGLRERLKSRDFFKGEDPEKSPRLQWAVDRSEFVF